MGKRKLLVAIHGAKCGGGRESKFPPSFGCRWFNSDPSLTTTAVIDWQKFPQFLLQRMTDKTAEDRMRYAKQFASILTNGDASELLQLPSEKRIQV